MGVASALPLCCPSSLRALAETAARGKRGTAAVARFMVDVDRHALLLAEELTRRAYRPGIGRSFTIHDPKRRQIYALPFRDRVVQHALVAATLPAIERTLGATTAAAPTYAAEPTVAPSPIRATWLIPAHGWMFAPAPMCTPMPITTVAPSSAPSPTSTPGASTARCPTVVPAPIVIRSTKLVPFDSAMFVPSVARFAM